MSLFKVRDFWSVLCDIDEKFDQNSIEISKLNNNCDNIIIGSHGGILRIYQPSGELNTETKCMKGFIASDLILEKIFTAPILQVATGKLVSGSQSVHIAVLHPKRLSVFSLISREGATDHGTQNILKSMYEHKLLRSAANFVIGPFGGSPNRDFIAVQSLDGLLTFYEQESFAFCCFLPNFLLPGPLVYSKSTDSFITFSSTWDIESFRYKRLSEAGQNSKEDASSGTKIKSDWKFSMGEGVIDIQHLTGTRNETFIAILGERNYYCLSDSGSLRFMKKLDFPPVCFSTYTLDEENKLMTLMVSSTNTLLVYENTSVKWSAQLSFLPTAIRRASLKGVQGALVLLSEDGRLECSYLGTEPQLFSAPAIPNSFDFEKAEDELTSLNRVIRSRCAASDAKLPNAAVDRELQTTISVNPHLEVVENVQTCHVSISVVPQVVLENVQVSMYVQKPLKCTPEIEFYKKLTEKITFRFRVALSENLSVPTLNMEVVISYISSVGAPRVIKKTEMLPLRLIMETCPPLKECEHKVVININKNPVPVAVIFPEFVSDAAMALTTTTTAICFRSLNGSGSPVTVLLAKSSQRYRLQSDSLLSLNTIAEQMIVRLKQHFASVNDFQITFNSQLPTLPFICYVKNHFEKRKEVNELQCQLGNLAGQFRVIQKKLISKFKDRTPTPLSNLERLLHDTYTEIIQLSEHLDAAQRNLETAQCDLSCALHLILNLVRITDVKLELLPMLEAALWAPVHDNEYQNWEDTIDSALCYLLSTTLCKSEKDQVKTQYAIDDVTDITKLERHITQVLDRVIKGGPDLETHFEGNLEEESNEQVREFLPIGSQIGQSSSRILSAKKHVSNQQLSFDNMDVEL